MSKVNKNKDIKIRGIEILYIILFSIAFLMRLGRYEVNFWLKYIISIIWIIIAFLQLLKNRFRIFEFNREIRFYFKLYMIPYIVMSVYDMFLFVSKRAEGVVFGRSVTYIVTMFITIIVVFATIYLLKDRALICTIYAMFLSFFIVFIFNIITNGEAAIKGVIGTFIDNSEAINYFELHDITFAFGLIFLFFVYNKNKLILKNFLITGFTIFLMLIGFKRIQLIAIAITCIYIFIIKRMKSNFRVKFIKVTGICVVITCFLYVWGIDSGIIELICNNFGINTMGRLSFYKWITTYSDINIKFLGIGLGASSKMMELYTGWHIATIHSDILRMFVEIGTIGFIVWLWYYLIYSYKRISEKFSLKIGSIYFVLTMYLYLLHFTDNTVNYFVTQYVYMLIVIASTINKK